MNSNCPVCDEDYEDRLLKGSTQKGDFVEIDGCIDRICCWSPYYLNQSEVYIHKQSSEAGGSNE